MRHLETPNTWPGFCSQISPQHLTPCSLTFLVINSPLAFIWTTNSVVNGHPDPPSTESMGQKHFLWSHTHLHGLPTGMRSLCSTLNPLHWRLQVHSAKLPATWSSCIWHGPPVSAFWFLTPKCSTKQKDHAAAVTSIIHGQSAEAPTQRRS